MCKVVRHRQLNYDQLHVQWANFSAIFGSVGPWKLLGRPNNTLNLIQTVNYNKKEIRCGLYSFSHLKLCVMSQKVLPSPLSFSESTESIESVENYF